MNLCAGQFRSRVIIQARAVIQTASGQTETWINIATRWANVVAIKTSGKAAYQQIGFDNVSHKIIFRGRVRYQSFKWSMPWLTFPWSNGDLLELNMETHRFSYDGFFWEMVEPQQDPDGRDTNTTVVVRKVVQDVNA